MRGNEGEGPGSVRMEHTKKGTTERQKVLAGHSVRSGPASRKLSIIVNVNNIVLIRIYHYDTRTNE